MKVLQVYTTDYPRVSGGVDAVVHNLLRDSREDGVQNLLRICPWRERDAGMVRTNGIEVYSLHLPTPPGRQGTLRAWLGFLATAPRAAWRLRRLLGQARPDLVHLHTLQHYHFYFVLARLWGGPPYVLSLHGSEVLAYESRDWLTRAVWRAILRGAAGISAVSATLMRDAGTSLPAATRVVSIRNGVQIVSDDALTAGEIHARFDLPPRYCVMVGHLSETKGHGVALRAWRHLPPSCADVVLVVVGDGKLADAYRNQAVRDGLATRVRFLGQLAHAETLAVMRASQILLMPSRREGFGLVAIEAGACGVPVIASDLPVFRELLGPEDCGLLVPLDDEQALARATALLLENASERIRRGAALRARVEHDFRIDDCLEQYRSWYRAAIINAKTMGRGRPS